MDTCDGIDCNPTCVAAAQDASTVGVGTHSPRDEKPSRRGGPLEVVRLGLYVGDGAGPSKDALYTMLLAAAASAFGGASNVSIANLTAPDVAAVRLPSSLIEPPPLPAPPMAIVTDEAVAPVSLMGLAALSLTRLWPHCRWWPLASQVRLGDFHVLVFPGGSGSAQASAIGEGGLAAVRSFVSAGGHYIGTCAGAFLALQVRRIGAPRQCR